MDQEQYSSLLELFAALPDPRQARGKRYAWSLILTLIAAALVSGAQGVRALSQWISERQPELLALLGGARQRLPGATTVRRALRVVDVADLEARARALGGPLAPARPASSGPPVLVGVALDGKRVNGANAHGAQVHLLSLTRHADACVLRQQAVAAKTNEIPAAPQLLAGLDLTNVVVTMDALLTQHAIATQIRRQHGHYLMVVKDNQPTLAADIALIFAGTCPVVPSDHFASVTTVDKHHGRLETRTLDRTAALNTYLTWPAVGQVLRRTCHSVILKTGLIRHEVSYALTSLPAAATTPAQLEALWRGHWTIENRVHYVRDVTFGEDAGQAWVGNAPEALAILRNLLLAVLRRHGWANIADAVRHYGAYAHRALTLLGAGPP
jgi:predicted transposase YbfD/YdcC